MTRLRLGLQLGLVATVALALTTCAAKPDATECSTGIICPEPLHCAAVQAVCITGLCGNGHIDPGEQCDDGNILAGDGCSPTCQLEECGNGVLDPGEVCDLGAANNGKCKGCSADCLSNESCGNGIIDPECGEVCDDGPTANTEGVCAVGSDGEHCGDHCKSDETCGNGVVDIGCGEVCDPPGVNGCQPGCTSAGSCGNGIVDPGEECDNGLDTMAPSFNCDNCDCRSDCVINRCGDGFVDSQGSEHHEDCDAAPQAGSGDRAATPTQSGSCNLDCTTAVCGDGKVNGSANEQCDNGSANANDADCTAGCQVNVCGDGHDDTVGPVHIEPCDLGSANGGSSGCSIGCTAPTCGNGIVDQGEQCDLGPANSNTGACLANCLLARCGDGFVETGVEQCDPGSAGGSSCSPTTSSAPCRFEICGNGILDPGEQCDNGSANGINGTCSTACKVQFCGDGIKNDGEACDTGGNSATCNLNCTVPRCGDGIVDPAFTPPGASSGEQCDPPNAAAGCSAECQFEHCGNGIIDPGEQCDPPGSVSGSGVTCSASCLNEVCGNGILDPGEQCDLGSASTGSAGGACPSCKLARCGDGLVEAGIEQCDLGSANGSGSGAGACDSLCRSVTCGNQILENGEQCDDGVENDGSGKRCNAACKFNVCGDGDLLIGVEQCDSGGVDSSTCNGSSCTLSVCGDGHINLAAGEACDNGAENGVAGGSCDATCHIPGCGNGIVEAGEACDPGTGTGSNARNVAGCNFNCTLPVCGDGITNTAAGESCDSGTQNGDPCPYGDPTCQVCNDTCTGSASPGGPYCGDGIVESAHESCDLGIGSNGATACPYGTASCTGCSSSCEPSILTGNVCGDGNVDPNPNNELCDDGNTLGCGTCSSNCKVGLGSPAVGTIVAVAGSQITAGDSFFLDDGIDGSAFFTFQTTQTKDTDIVFSAGDDAVAVAGEIETAINRAHATPVLLTAATPTGVFVTVTHLRHTFLGNTHDDQALQDGIVVIGMEGGQAGDCAAGITCRLDDDCQSNNCDTTTNQCSACDPTSCIAAGGNCAGNDCVIAATGDGDIACPFGLACNITCGDGTCSGMTFDCHQADSCVITCSGTGACSNDQLEAGSSATTLVCTGPSSCASTTVTCGTGGDCEDDFAGAGCGSGAGSGLVCTGNCTNGPNCL
jgi:cysteine-rich repeat protein